MCNLSEFQYFTQQFCWLMPAIVILAVWDLTWKAIGMWKAAQNKELVWFICIAIFNTIGILPIIYILLNKKRSAKTD